MKRKKVILTSVLLSGSMGLGAQALFAQAGPGPTVPNPRPEQPRQTQPTIPGQPAPGLPQTEPVPGGPGTIPERVRPPDAGSSGNMVISANDIRKAQQALKAKGMDPGPVNGEMNSRTQEALSKFQKANNLPATGVLDKKTADKLGVSFQGSEHETRGAIPDQGKQNGNLPNSREKGLPNSQRNPMPNSK